MNDNKKFYNLKEVENKLHNFEEGKDYFVTPSREPEIKDYTFYNDRLKSLFGGNNWVPVKVWQEKFDGKDMRYRGHFEEGKDYRYSAQHWNYEKDYQGDRGIEDMPDWVQPVFAGREEGISSHSKVEVYGEGGKFNSGKMLKSWERKWIYEGKGSVTESLGPVEKGNSEPKAINVQPKEILPAMPCATCDKRIESNQGHYICKEHKGHHCSKECAEKWYKCHMEWVSGDKKVETKKPANSDLEKENHELRHQLVQVQAELAKVLVELKKLTGKGDEKLEQQQAENEKAIKQGSVAEIKAQMQKSQALMREAGTQTKATTPEKSEPGNGALPYVAVGSLLVAGLGGGVIYWWKKHSSKK